MSETGKWGIYGPDKHHGKWRVRVRAPDGNVRPRRFESRAEALAYKAKLEEELSQEAAHRRAAEFFAKGEQALAEAELAGHGRRTVNEAMDAYEVYRRKAGRVAGGTIVTDRYRQEALLAITQLGKRAVVSIREHDAKAAYDARASDPEISPGTHQNELKAVRKLWRWLILEKWTTHNPWACVEPRGQIPKGKEQLRPGEVQLVINEAIARARGERDGFGRHNDSRRKGGLAVLLILYVGLRASETIGLERRDIEADGRAIWYRPAKQRGESRVRKRLLVDEELTEVHQLLRAYRESLSEPTARLFPYRIGWPRNQVKATCRAVGVPEICAHGGRGTHASLATDGGATSEQVAHALSHSSTAVTEAHYIRSDRGDSRSEQVVRALRPSRTRKDIAAELARRQRELVQLRAELERATERQLDIERAPSSQDKELPR